MKRFFFLIFLYLVSFNFMVIAEEKNNDVNQKLISGYFFSKPETQEMQDDDFLNPAFLWIDQGHKLWNQKLGENSFSCQECHGNVENMKGVSSFYPKYDNEVKKVINIEQRINICRKKNSKLKSFQAESKNLISLSALISSQSRKLPMNVNISGEANSWFKRGKELYFKRIGQMNVSCNQCHDDRTGLYLRAERVSQGHINGFPSYLLRWNKVASVHKRFQFCNEQARASPLPIFADDYNALQLYLAWRGNGLKIESPSVRK